MSDEPKQTKGFVIKGAKNVEIIGGGSIGNDVGLEATDVDKLETGVLLS
jgi:hypothetical protein